MGFMTEKFEKLKQEANLQAFLSKEEITEKGREKRKLEAKKDKTEEDEKKIRQIQQETERLASRQQQAQQIVNRASLGEKILKCYFAYKMASLLCRTFLEYGRDQSGYGNAPRLDFDMEDRPEQGDFDIHHARAEQIEQVRDQFDKINEEAKTLGISQDDVFTQQDKDKLTDLAAISRDQNNPQQAELYASKCEELGLDRSEALQAFQQDKNLDTVQNEIKQTKEQGQSYEIEM
jgi:hypothetical protein